MRFLALFLSLTLGFSPVYGAVSAPSSYTGVGAGGMTSSTVGGIGAANSFTVSNPDNTSTASHAYLEAAVGGTSGGNPHVRFTITGGGSSWYVGNINTSSDLFAIGVGTTIDTANSAVLLSTSTSAPAMFLGTRAASAANFLIGYAQGNSNGSVELSARDSVDTSANIKLYANSHATKANIIEFRVGSTVGPQINASGQLLPAVGAQSAPGIAWPSDLDSGIYYVGSNRTGIASNGALQADFDDNQLGVGRTGTTNQYSIYRANTSTSSSLRLAGSSSGGGEFIAYSSGHATLAGLIGVVTTLATNGTDAATLLNGPANTAGNPDVWFRMQVNGTTYVIPAWTP